MSEHDLRDCADITPYLSPFADGELAEPLRSQVAAHIATCDDCAARLNRIRDVDRLIGSLPHTAPSAGVFERTLAAAARHSSADPRAVTRERLGAGRGPELRRRLREALAPDQADRDAPDYAASERPTPSRRRKRPPWVAAAIPAAAALLLVALAATLFNRFPSFPRQAAPSVATPNPATPLQQTVSAISALAGQLAFAPLSPSYLPAGASAPRRASARWSRCRRTRATSTSPGHSSLARSPRCTCASCRMGWPLTATPLATTPPLARSRRPGCNGRCHRRPDGSR